MFRLFCLAVLIILSVVDALYMMVPDAGVAALLAAALIWVPPETLAEGLPAAAAVWGVYALCVFICMRLEKEAPVGAGDIKLLGALALFLGSYRLLVLLAAACMASGAFAALLLLFKKAGPKSRIPFVPFIAAGYAAAISTEAAALI